MRIAHCGTWDMARKLTNSGKEKITWQDMERGEKPEKKNGKWYTNTV